MRLHHVLGQHAAPVRVAAIERSGSAWIDSQLLFAEHLGHLTATNRVEPRDGQALSETQVACRL